MAIRMWMWSCGLWRCVPLYVVTSVLKGSITSILILKMEAIYFFESLVTTYETTWHHRDIQIPQLIIPPDTQKHTPSSCSHVSSEIQYLSWAVCCLGFSCPGWTQGRQKPGILSRRRYCWASCWWAKRGRRPVCFLVLLNTTLRLKGAETCVGIWSGTWESLVAGATHASPHTRQHSAPAGTYQLLHTFLLVLQGNICYGCVNRGCSHW